MFNVTDLNEEVKLENWHRINHQEFAATSLKNPDFSRCDNFMDAFLRKDNSTRFI